MDYVKDFQDSADKDKDEECGSKDKDLVFVDKNHSDKDIQNGPQGFSRPQGLSSKTTLAHTHTTHTPICAVQDGAEKCRGEAERDDVSSRSSVRYFRQTRSDPGMHLGNTERTRQLQFVERPAQ